MSRKQAAEGFSAFGTDPRRYMVLELGVRYRTPQDNTTVMNVFHKTTDGGVSVLLERETFHHLSEWLDGGRISGRLTIEAPDLFDVRTKLPLTYQEVGITDRMFEIHGTQTSARIVKPTAPSGPALAVSISWNGSGRSRSISLDRASTDRLTDWMVDADAHGWTGWRSGRADTAEA